MSQVLPRKDFENSELGIKTRQALVAMNQDSGYITKSAFSADTQNYSNNLIPFVDFHMQYLKTHRNINPEHYISNLRLMTRVR